ncbi:AraC family transcriptional regulator [Paenibacillus sp. IB182496]|uniref:AraC family transcriptional regulator n=1 Tax=Paenibacillus sabuli TaxID=2772509 RepID=A0A927BSQ2_9BACL|nr:AraC family transcriptional regulator [Paenibacillus sabuli]MBD2846072.1 AraC family transcriptional regulator [Paenibacillus sabuli]
MRGKWKSIWNGIGATMQSHYRKSLITVLLLSSLPGMAIGLFVYWVIESQIEQELQLIHRNQLEQAAENIDNQFSNIEMFLSHWAYDANFNESLTQLDLAYGYEQVHEIYRTLLSMEGSNPLFERVELFVNTPQPLVLTESGYKQLVSEQEINMYEGLLTNLRPLQWSDSFAGVSGYGASRPHTLSIVHKLSGTRNVGRAPYGALIVYLDRERVLDQVKTLTPYNQGTTFLFADTGEFLLTATPDNRPSELDRLIYAEMAEHDEQASTFLYEREGSGASTYSVTYGQFRRLGSLWYYVSAAPISSITAPVVFVSRLIIAMNLGVLLVAGLLAWLASRRLYSPIARLVQRVQPPRRESERASRNEFELIESRWNDLSRESTILQRRLDQHLPQLREGFLMQLLQGYLYSFTEQELAERMVQFGWEVQGSRYRIMMVRLTGFQQLEGRFSEGDEGLVSFAAANIVRELTDESELEADVINFHDLTFGVLLVLPGQWSAQREEEELGRLSAETMACIGKLLRLHTTIALSRSGQALKAIAALYEETRLALGLRDLQEEGQIIDLARGASPADRSGGGGYPFDLEKEMVYALRLGSEDEAVRLIDAFVAQLRQTESSEADVKQSMLTLLGAILHVVLQSGIRVQQLYEGANLYEQLSGLSEPEQMAEWMRQRVVQPFVRQWSAQKDRQLKEAVEQAVIVLGERYQEDISLEYCADRVGMHPSAFSKAFKRMTGLNFIDYVTQLRLEQARLMLRDTDAKISEVAEEVGYQHSYFNRLFKKHEGVTPSQYRQRSREARGGAEQGEGEDDDGNA